MDEIITARIDHMRLRGLSERTIQVNRDHLRRLARFLHPTPLLEASHDELMAWATALSHLAPRTRYAELSRTHGFYCWAAEAGLRGDVPSAKVPRPKVPRSLPRPISEDRLEVALEGAPPDIFAWLTLAGWAGMRCCEIAPLTRDRVLDTVDPPLIFVTGKGSKDRVIPAHPRVLLALRAYGMPSRGWVFHRRDDRPGPPTAMRVSWLCNRWLREHGIPDTMHSLRHRAVSGVYQNSGDLYVAASFAGHANVSTTTGYAVLSPQRVAAAVFALA